MDEQNKILVGIIVQQFQPITSNEVIAQGTKLGYELEQEEVIYVLENMQRRDLLSVVYQSKNNKRVKAYGMSKPIFKKCPETAHLKDILPSLINKKEYKDFLDMLEGQTSDTKKKRELLYRDYKTVSIELETIQPIVGGSLNKPKVISQEIKETLKKIEEGKKKKKTEEESMESISYLNRNYEGKPYYPSNAVRQYFLKNLRIAGLGDTAVNQIDFNEAIVEPNGHKFYVEQWPVIIGGQGRGIQSAEALPPGITIKTQFSFPFTGTKIESPEKLKKVIEYQARNGRGFSSYSKKFGKCKLTQFDVKRLPWE